MQCEEDVIYEESDNCEANLNEKFISDFVYLDHSFVLLCFFPMEFNCNLKIDVIALCFNTACY